MSLLLSFTNGVRHHDAAFTAHRESVRGELVRARVHCLRAAARDAGILPAGLAAILAASVVSM